MRDINRIPIILSLIEEIWRQYPDLRFWQFKEILQHVVNTNFGKPRDSDLFYLEDDNFIEVLKEIKEDI